MPSMVYFRFKSNLTQQNIPFEGSAISVNDLKSAIRIKNGMKSNDFDLILMTTDGKDYGEKDLIPAYSSVIVRRMPVINYKHTNKTINPENFKRSDPYRLMRNNEIGRQLKIVNLATSNLTEDQKEDLVVEISSNMYSVSKRVQVGPLPLHYLCNKCNVGGHWIKDCPGIADKDGRMLESKLVKRPSGIPTSNLTEVDSTTPNSYLTTDGRYVVNTKNHEAYLKGKKDKRPFSQEENPPRPVVVDDTPSCLLCSLCHSIFNDPISVPCCGKVFCKKCAINAIFDQQNDNFHRCPNCQHSVNVLDSLVDQILLGEIIRQWQIKKAEEGMTAKQSKDNVIIDDDLTDEIFGFSDKENGPDKIMLINDSYVYATKNEPINVAVKIPEEKGRGSTRIEAESRVIPVVGGRRTEMRREDNYGWNRGDRRERRYNGQNRDRSRSRPSRREDDRQMSGHFRHGDKTANIVDGISDKENVSHGKSNESSRNRHQIRNEEVQLNNNKKDCSSRTATTAEADRNRCKINKITKDSSSDSHRVQCSTNNAVEEKKKNSSKINGKSHNVEHRSKIEKSQLESDGKRDKNSNECSKNHRDKNESLAESNRSRGSDSKRHKERMNESIKKDSVDEKGSKIEHRCRKEEKQTVTKSDKSVEKNKERKCEEIVKNKDGLKCKTDKKSDIKSSKNKEGNGPIETNGKENRHKTNSNNDEKINKQNKRKSDEVGGQNKTNSDQLQKSKETDKEKKIIIKEKRNKDSKDEIPRKDAHRCKTEKKQSKSSCTNEEKEDKNNQKDRANAAPNECENEQLQIEKERKSRKHDQKVDEHKGDKKIQKKDRSVISKNKEQMEPEVVKEKKEERDGYKGIALGVDIDEEITAYTIRTDGQNKEIRTKEKENGDRKHDKNSHRRNRDESGKKSVRNRSRERETKKRKYNEDKSDRHRSRDRKKSSHRKRKHRSVSSSSERRKERKQRKKRRKEEKRSKKEKEETDGDVVKERRGKKRKHCKDREAAVVLQSDSVTTTTVDDRCCDAKMAAETVRGDRSGNRRKRSDKKRKSKEEHRVATKSERNKTEEKR